MTREELYLVEWPSLRSVGGWDGKEGGAGGNFAGGAQEMVPPASSAAQRPAD